MDNEPKDEPPIENAAPAITAPTAPEAVVEDEFEIPETEIAPPVEETPVEQPPTSDEAINLHLHISCNDTKKVRELIADFEEFKKDDVDVRGTDTHRIMSTSESPVLNMASDKIQKEILDKAGESFREEKLLKNNSWKCGTTVSGKQAALAFAARNRGIYRLRLYNSGFHIMLKPLSVGQLNALMESIDFEGERLGRIIGNFQYLVFSATLKSAVMQLLPEIVVGSNLKGWENGNTLVKNIAFNDYDPIIWAISSMLADRKLEVGGECYGCNTSFNITYDYSKFHLIRMIPANALEEISSEPENLDRGMLVKYKEQLHADTDTSFKWKDIKLEFEEPSLFDWVECANDILGTIESKMVDEPSISNNKVMVELLTTFNSNFTPWIKCIKQLNEDGMVDFSTSDKSQFAGILSTINLGKDDSTLKDALEKFIYGSRASVIGYKPSVCPNCGDVQSCENGYIAWDPEQVFFEVAYRILEGSMTSVSE